MQTPLTPHNCQLSINNCVQAVLQFFLLQCNFVLHFLLQSFTIFGVIFCESTTSVTTPKLIGNWCSVGRMRFSGISRSPKTFDSMRLSHASTLEKPPILVFIPPSAHTTCYWNVVNLTSFPTVKLTKTRKVNCVAEKNPEWTRFHGNCAHPTVVKLLAATVWLWLHCVGMGDPALKVYILSAISFTTTATRG